MEYQTERLILRLWKQSDREPFAAMNASPEVMRYFPNTRTREESDNMVNAVEQILADKGWGLWAVEEKSSGAFIGFVGLNIPGYELPFSPVIEIGWRLDKPFWGKGYAPEAARKALEIGFNQYAMDEIVAFTALENQPSQRVMEKIGMHRCEEFDHPALKQGQPLCRHVLYRITKNQML
ncbi:MULTISPECIES: GNAT family N-acetyltransferase [Buttiauxella]|jgi:ribosomal-protein-alanine N-acetyltransferase|uniref:GNAT family N-acetyltransferase n=1 Tax=Buttiauxella TaxID=82976 RepID=UPI000EF7700C|nr:MULTISPECIES: GNAT family N-acetyltransferase [Buttiauxella]AYN26107.1 N-acetyltransferase [Buttiauxella sp. 3AFRM03]MCE0824605.1 GNAT family N-acetyltransferase [Buttiauxella ferragutiae]TDN54360.1 ribosomal-protein-alanine N-acetyltransferase [Buttiauxella sp. JUb87]UNK63599.1 GNAT family N-acetyltransferase [Buttiauxella ferragutiae]